eukprot:7622110-Pyramimonas_sp.AAC.1
MKTLGGTHCMKPKNRHFSIFSALASEASFTCSEERCVRRELYKVPGGNLVDGLPPVPSFTCLLYTSDAADDTPC